jgi:hypothetical protein
VKFAYARYSETVVRPVIRVQVRSGKRSADYELLVDSGADINFLDTELADDLGINRGEPIPSDNIDLNRLARALLAAAREKQAHDKDKGQKSNDAAGHGPAA